MNLEAVLKSRVPVQGCQNVSTSPLTSHEEKVLHSFSRDGSQRESVAPSGVTTPTSTVRARLPGSPGAAGSLGVAWEEGAPHARVPVRARPPQSSPLQPWILEDASGCPPTQGSGAHARPCPPPARGLGPLTVEQPELQERGQGREDDEEQQASPAPQEPHRRAHGQAGRQGDAGRRVVVSIEVLEQWRLHLVAHHAAREAVVDPEAGQPAGTQCLRPPPPGGRGTPCVASRGRAAPRKVAGNAHQRGRRGGCAWSPPCCGLTGCRHKSRETLGSDAVSHEIQA